MSTSISARMQAHYPEADPRDIRLLFEALKADVVTLKSAVDALATKLNADTGVTDTDYAGAGELTIKD